LVINTRNHQGIVNQAARHHSFANPLCSVAEQVYLTGLLHGFGPDDDAGMIRVYCKNAVFPLSEPVATQAEDQDQNTALVLALLTAIHTVAAAEAISFTAKLGLDLSQFQTLVKEAAGASWAFKEFAPGMESVLSGKAKAGSEKGSLAEIRNGLVEAVAKARTLSCPLFLGSAALEVLTKVTVSGDGDGGKEVADVVRYYL
jgi:3-hydroxyisobutyrate dehydrogenase